MNALQTKQTIITALQGFSSQPLAAALSLFESLGYRSQKRLPLNPNTPGNFCAMFRAIASRTRAKRENQTD